MGTGEGTRRVLLAVGGLDGGPRRSLRLLIGRLPRSRFEVHVAGALGDTTALGTLPGDVPIHELDGSPARAASRLAGLATRLRADSLICASPELSDALLRKRSAIPESSRLVIRAHASLAEAQRSPLGGRRRRRHYARADAIVCGGDDLRRALASSLRLPEEKLVTIYDPVDAESVREEAASSRNPFSAKGLGPHVLAVGPLEPGQGHETLVDSLPALIERFADARLWILGEDRGGAAEALRLRAARLGVEEALLLFGPPEFPGAWLAHADLLAIASQQAEPALVLLDALACECPVIALAPPAASAEILRVAGCAHRGVKTLNWQREWFRGGAEEQAPTLTAFEPEAALSGWQQVLVQSS